MIYTKWSKDEIAFLRENYVTLTARGVANRLNRSKESVQGKWAMLKKPPRVRKDAWTEQELAFLRENYDELGAKEVGHILGRSSTAVTHKASRAGIQIQASTGYRNRIALRLRAPSDTKEANCISTWRKLVKGRDDFTCQKCGLREPLIVAAHHIKSVAEGGNKFAIDNGITLCPNCHAMEHALQKKYTARRLQQKDKDLAKDLLQKGVGISEVAGQLKVNTKTVQNISDQIKAKK